MLKKILKSHSSFIKLSAKFSTCVHHEAFKQILENPRNQILIHSKETPQEKYVFDWQAQYRPPKSWKTPYILFPKTTKETSKILQYCNENDISVVPQAGNTSLVGGASIFNENEILLNFEKMNKILDFNENNGIISLEPGVILEDLQNFLEKNGRFETPYDLGARGSCMAGGNVSSLAGGINFVKFGSLRNYILGLEVVLPDGRIMDLTSKIKKDNVGLDLKEIFIGSEGTLGIITKIDLRCERMVEDSELIFLQVDNFQKILDLEKLAKDVFGKDLCAVEYLDRECYNLVHDIKGSLLNFPFQKKTEGEREFYLLVENSKLKSEESPSEKLENFFIEIEDVIDDIVLATNKSQYEDIWGIRESVVECANKAGYVFKYDVSVPPEYFDELVKKSRDLFKNEVDVTGGYGHIGDGNIHLNIVRYGGKDGDFAEDGRLSPKEVKKKFESEFFF